eukprot:7356675-Alexandrium_andersonii.AAC.1
MLALRARSCWWPRGGRARRGALRDELLELGRSRVTTARDGYKLLQHMPDDIARERAEHCPGARCVQVPLGGEEGKLLKVGWAPASLGG